MLSQANSNLSARRITKLINRGKDLYFKDELSQKDLVTLKVLKIK